MDIQNYTTEHRKGQHLLAEERHEIEVRLKDGWSPYRIAKHLGRAYNTIKNEIARGTVSSSCRRAWQSICRTAHPQHSCQRKLDGSTCLTSPARSHGSCHPKPLGG